MFSTIAFLTVIVSVLPAQAFDANSVICLRLPDNPNCPRSRSDLGRPSPSVNPPPQPQLQPQPLPQAQPLAQPQAAPQPQAPSPQDVRQACLSMKANYDQHCTSNVQLSADAQSYCDLYTERCLGLIDNSAPPSGGFGPYRYAPAGSQLAGNKRKFGSKWLQLTRQAETKEQLQQVDSAEKWLYDCGVYNLQYNAFCYPNASNYICNTLRRVCLSHAEDLAAGQTPVNGPFAHNNGLPTGGAGSSRPLTTGSNIEVGPFFNLGSQQAINPLQGFGQSTQLQVPVAGLGATISKGTDYGGLIGISQLGQLLDGKRRRRRASKKI